MISKFYGFLEEILRLLFLQPWHFLLLFQEFLFYLKNFLEKVTIILFAKLVNCLQSYARFTSPLEIFQRKTERFVRIYDCRDIGWSVQTLHKSLYIFLSCHDLLVCDNDDAMTEFFGHDGLIEPSNRLIAFVDQSFDKKKLYGRLIRLDGKSNIVGIFEKLTKDIELTNIGTSCRQLQNTLMVLLAENIERNGGIHHIGHDYILHGRRMKVKRRNWQVMPMRLQFIPKHRIIPSR